MMFIVWMYLLRYESSISHLQLEGTAHVLMRLQGSSQKRPYGKDALDGCASVTSQGHEGRLTLKAAAMLSSAGPNGSS